MEFETTKYFKRKDNLKELMLVALPEYEEYINEYGFSGYYNLLGVLEEKLLTKPLPAVAGRIMYVPF